MLGAPEAAAATPSPQRASVPASLQHAAPPPLSSGIFSQSFVSSSFNSCTSKIFLTMLPQLVLPLLALGDTESSSSEIASSRQSDSYGAPYAPPQQYQVIVILHW